MTRVKPILPLFLFLLSFVGFAQSQDVVRCYTMEADQALRDRYPELGTLEDFEEWLAPRVRAYEQSPQERVVTTVPIIFHIIHNGTSVGTGTNISATYVDAQIDQLNNDFRRILGTSGYNSDPRGADTELEFCPATVDPNGNTLAEPGINRIDRNSQGWNAPPYNTGYIDGAIKPQSIWNPDDYVNVWVMQLSGGLLGYAQFPSQSGLPGINANGGPASTDGVVVLYSSVGSTDAPFPGGSPFNLGRTLTHELGHFFGLRHIWGDATCGNDYCSDTPEAQGPASGCPNNTTCDGQQDMVENYMDYSSDACMNIFTGDQKSRIQAVLSNSPRRNTLNASTACSGGGGGGGLACNTTVSTFPYAESFESSLGDWTQDGGDDFDWSRNSGGTPSGDTGPGGAVDGSWYVYVESSSPNYSNLTTILNSPCFDLAGQTVADFSFSYHMYGASDMGSLYLEARTDGSSWNTVWSQSGNQGDLWQSTSVDLSAYLGETVQLRFRGVTGTTWQGDMAVDDLGLSTTSGGGGGDDDLSCNTTISSFPYDEGFEGGLGDWSQDNNDDFNWSRNSGGTPSSNTGPSSAASGNWYAYVESSNPNYPSLTTILNSPCFDLSGLSSAGFSFSYHMLGSSNMGSLYLDATTDGSAWTTIWSKSGNQGNSWLNDEVDLSDYAGATVQLRFRGLTGSTWQGDMAIDNFNLSESSSGGGGNLSCSTTVSAFPYNESFEGGFGNWLQDNTDNFDWTRNSGGTPSSSTGPNGAAAGEWYAYVESSNPNYPGLTAILNSPCFDLSGLSNPSFGFAYHLFGSSNMGGLDLEITTDGSTWTSLWSRSGNQGASWLNASIDLSAYAGSTVQLRFRGLTGTTWQGDMAVDAISLSEGGSDGGCNTVTVTINLDNYPEETSWEITDPLGTVLAAGGAYGSQPDGSTVVENACLPDGCYDFTIFDSYGDGICCAYGFGSYEVRDGANNLLASGARFGSSETTNFCVSGGVRIANAGTTAQTTRRLDAEPVLACFPNPTRNQLTVSFAAKAEGLVRMRLADLFGRTVRMQEWPVIAGKNQESLDVSDLEAGAYLLLIETGDQRFTQRFVVVK